MTCVFASPQTVCLTQHYFLLQAQNETSDKERNTAKMRILKIICMLFRNWVTKSQKRIAHLLQKLTRIS
jgi:hypothetical protein